MNPGDKVYYRYTGKGGTPIKFAAIVLAARDDGWLIRVGRYDVHKRDIKTFESVVDASSLEARSVSCSFEDELTAGDPHPDSR